MLCFSASRPACSRLTAYRLWRRNGGRISHAARARARRTDVLPKVPFDVGRNRILAGLVGADQFQPRLQMLLYHLADNRAFWPARLINRRATGLASIMVAQGNGRHRFRERLYPFPEGRPIPAIFEACFVVM